MQTTKVWTESEIVTLLQNSDKAVEKGIVAIFKRQTQDEKATSATRHSNNVGFSAAHAHLGSYYAKWIMSGRKLTGTHLAKARSLTQHYRKQLCSIANENVKQEQTGTFQQEKQDKCDLCGCSALGTEYFHLGSSVLFTCYMCQRGDK